MRTGRKIAAVAATAAVGYAAWLRPRLMRWGATDEEVSGPYPGAELPGGHTRLVISGYQAVRPRWIERFAFDWLYVPAVWPMQARMMAVLKRNIERAARVRSG